MLILGVDPSPTKTAWVIYAPASHSVLDRGFDDNEKFRAETVYKLKESHSAHSLKLVIEKIESFGGKFNQDPLYETCFCAGRIIECWESSPEKESFKYLPTKRQWDFMTRKQVKKILTGKTNTGDPEVNFRLRCMFGEPPAPRKPKGMLIGVYDDIWAALAVAVAYCA